LELSAKVLIVVTKLHTERACDCLTHWVRKSWLTEVSCVIAKQTASVVQSICVLPVSMLKHTCARWFGSAKVMSIPKTFMLGRTHVAPLARLTPPYPSQHSAYKFHPASAPRFSLQPTPHACFCLLEWVKPSCLPSRSLLPNLTNPLYVV
jgi:hypothetical protein